MGLSGGGQVPLAVRRRWPFGVALAVGVMSMGYGIANLPDPPVFYATLVSLYTVAAHASRRKANVAAVFAGVGLVSVVFWDRTDSDYQDLVVNGAVFATALLGDSTRSQVATEPPPWRPAPNSSSGPGPLRRRPRSSPSATASPGSCTTSSPTTSA